MTTFNENIRLRYLLKRQSNASQFESVHAIGIYRGSEVRFQGRRAVLKLIPEGTVQAQFNNGALWETHSWITFLVEDWTIETLILEPWEN